MVFCQGESTNAACCNRLLLPQAHLLIQQYDWQRAGLAPHRLLLCSAVAECLVQQAEAGACGGGVRGEGMTSVPQGSAEKPPEGVHHIWPYTGQLKAVELKHLGAAGRQAGRANGPRRRVSKPAQQRAAQAHAGGRKVRRQPEYNAPTPHRHRTSQRKATHRWCA